MYSIEGIRLVDVPNILLQNDWRINVYAYDRNYTKHSECFKVVKRSKPADYVYTETEIKRYEDLEDRISALEEGGVPVGPGTGGSGLTTAMVNALDGLFKLAVYKADASAQYDAFCVAFGLSDEPDVPVDPDEPDVPDIPDVPVEPEITLVSISATYSGDSVTLGTDVNTLKTNLLVIANYSDNSTAEVSNYTLTGIVSAVGENVITVTYENVTTTFIVIGYIEQDIPSDVVIPEGYELVKVLEADDIVYGVSNFNANASNSNGYRASYPYYSIPVYRGYTYRMEVEYNVDFEMYVALSISPPGGTNGSSGAFVYDSGWIKNTPTVIEVDVVETNTAIKDIGTVAWLNPGFRKADNTTFYNGDIKRVVISRKYIEGAITGGDEWELVRTLTTNDIVYGMTNYGTANDKRAAYPYLDIPVEAGYYYHMETETNVDYEMLHALTIAPPEGATHYTDFVYDGGWKTEIQAPRTTDTPITIKVTADNTNIKDISKVAWATVCYKRLDEGVVEDGCIKHSTITRRKV